MTWGPHRRPHRAGDPGEPDHGPARRRRRRHPRRLRDEGLPAAVEDNIALVQRGGGTFLEKAINARAAGAQGGVLMNEGQTNRTQPGTTTNGTPFTRVAGQTYPGLMAATLSYATGKEFYDAVQAGAPLTVHFKTDNTINQRIDYDVIAETPQGDPTRVL